MFDIEESAEVRLSRLEHRIESGLRAGFEAYELLRQIRDDELYAARGYSSFLEYVKKEWGISRRVVDMNIAACDRLLRLRDKVPDETLSVLSRERQVRLLNDVSDDQVQPVLEEAKRLAVESGTRVDLGHIRRAKKQVIPVVAPTASPSSFEFSVEDSVDTLTEELAEESEGTPVPSDSLVERARRIAIESLDRLELQLSHLGMQSRWEPTLEKIRDEVRRV